MDDANISEVVTNIRETFCVICKLCFGDEKSVTVAKKGVLRLIYYGNKRGRLDLISYLTDRLTKILIGNVLVHQNCRRDFTDHKRGVRINTEAEAEVVCPKILRSSFVPFNWKEDCMLCVKSAAVDTRHPNRRQVHTVTTLPIRRKLLKCCDLRGELWASVVNTRLHGCIDLVASEAVYHHQCFSRLMHNYKQSTTSIAKKVSGRPKDIGMLHRFEMLYMWLDSEADAELCTLAELHSKMAEFSGESEIYSIKRLKQKLQEHYKECIFFAEVEGRGSVVCFRNMARCIINEKWYSYKEDNIEDEDERIVTAAAKIIRAEIRECKYDSEFDPTNEDIANIDRGRQWVPRHLQTLLKIIVVSELKQNSIGHCIDQLARPRSVITPTLFGLGVEMDHVFGLKWLINEMSRLGFSISYDEVTRFKQSVIQSESFENLFTEYFPRNFYSMGCR